jgi:hypothetical protein
MERPKDLQEIAKQKIQQPADGQIIPAPAPTQQEIISNALPKNHILNVIESLKTKQNQDAVWFDFTLPSNGKCGYPKEIKLREMTTLDEKILIKEMFSSKENSILNIIRKCAKFETLPDFDFENLTTFDQDYILIELSAITFPGEKEITVTDDANHKLTMKLNKDELSLSSLPFDAEYPFKVSLPTTQMTWYLSFMTIKKMKEIDKTIKSMSPDILTKFMISIAMNTTRVELFNQEVVFDNFYEVVKLLESLPPSDLKELIAFYNEKTTTAYGYKLVKEFYCAECAKGGQMELEPLNFFRITL